MTRPKDLAKARPSLFRIAPLTATICWLFAVVNFFVFYCLFFVFRPKVPLLFVTNFFNFQVWGLAFLIIGLIGGWTLIRNNWNATRKTLMAGVIVKSAWEITLIYRVFYDKQTMLTAIMWGFLTFVQVATYVFFMPEVTEGRDSEQQSR